ncbi:hypothetical protein EVAR_59975_1 [Eumeta japonica]|uniref:RNA-directed DNA polymerase from mobile element jockey n=1 Tax=Eumeta variegata TaxID=151549 RepID=A0A4C1YSE3_EUMVA|nr:hypothetical protein EVAR_59975_1 [Eumeta japonica]
MEIHPTYDDVNNAISKVEKWFSANNLLLNEMKTKCIRFSLPNVRHGSGTISVRNKELEFVNCTVFLGITLDNRLQWGPHISRTCTGITVIVGLNLSLSNIAHRSKSLKKAAHSCGRKAEIYFDYA